MTAWTNDGDVVYRRERGVFFILNAACATRCFCMNVKWLAHTSDDANSQFVVAGNDQINVRILVMWAAVRKA